MEHQSEEILKFWLEEAGPKKWYVSDPEFDAEIADRFGAMWEEARTGAFADWAGHPRKALALIILLDQFPRNMFRGEARSYATDGLAKTAACYALDRGWDLRADEPERQFFYMPFMHSELLPDQDHSVRLMLQRMTGAGGSNLLHARAHREIIRKFGRFPYRNEALGRHSSVDEESFLKDGGYGAILQELQAAA